MNLVEALRDSKATGRTYVRRSGSGWLRWHEPWTYRFSNEEVLADDWVVLGEDTGDPTVWEHLEGGSL